MELKSLSYIMYVAIVAIVYFGVKKIENAQKFVLLVANTIFIFITSGIGSTVIIIILTLFSYCMGILIENAVFIGNKNKAKRLMWFDILCLISILCYFKFFKEGFILFYDILSGRGAAMSSLVSPIGISYYTLSMIAYVIDIFHKKHPAEKNIVDYFVFITFFPAIVQGPVNLYRKIAPQLKKIHEPNEDRILMGIQRLIWGYFKKVVIADRIGIIVSSILSDNMSSGILLFWAMVLYSFQIYADFSGGIDVIMGISEILDIKLTENFKSPFVSKSITEYWKRWHISLGEFMEKYIYYPIVLHRNLIKLSSKFSNKYLSKVFSAVLASVIVFVTVGIWHGTGWNYVMYGIYQALFVSLAVLLGPLYKKMRILLRVSERSISWNLFRTIRTFTILTFGRYFIRAKNLTQAFELFKRTFLGFTWSDIGIFFDGTLFNYGLDYKNIYLMNGCIILMILIDVLHEKKYKFRETVMKQDIVFRYAVYLFAIFAIIIWGIYGPEFSSTSFIYQEF